MLNININGFCKDVSNYMKQTIKFKEPINISTEDGNVIMLSEDDYRGLIETLYLKSIPGMEEKLIEGMNTPLSECLSESEVEW